MYSNSDCDFYFISSVISSFMGWYICLQWLILECNFNINYSSHHCIISGAQFIEICICHKGSFIKYVCKIFRKTKISNPLIRTRTYAYQEVRNVSFLENFTYALSGWHYTLDIFQREAI